MSRKDELTAVLQETETLKTQLQVREVEREQYESTVELFQERLAELELALEDTGWLRMTQHGDREFSRWGLKKMLRVARFSYLKNPLINHAVNVQANYVWGQGCNIIGKIDEINDYIQAFLDDPYNRREFTGHEAKMLREIEQRIEGNTFIGMFTNRSTGWVKLRCFPTDEILDIIANPQDDHEIWYYHRTWYTQEWDPVTGTGGGVQGEAYYPDYQYSPSVKPVEVNGIQVMWDCPIKHVKTGGLSDMKFGVPEIYSSLDWARAVKEDLEDYATIRRALARFAWKMQVKGGAGAVKTTKTRLESTMGVTSDSVAETNPPATVGSTFIASQGAEMHPIKTAGAQPPPEEGRRLWLMISAGTSLPETMLSGDATVGNYATAKSLDRPTELHMRNRQQLWANVYRDILTYVIDQAVICANGSLPGRQQMNPFSKQMEVVMDTDQETGEPVDRSIDIDFPPILQHDPLPMVQAIVTAATLGNTQGLNAKTIDDRTLAKLLLSALGEDDADEMLNELFPGNEVTTDIGAPPTFQAGITPPTATPSTGNSTSTQESGFVAAMRELREAILPLMPLLMNANPEVLERLQEPRGVYPHRHGVPHPHKGHPGYRGPEKTHTTSETTKSSSSSRSGGSSPSSSSATSPKPVTGELEVKREALLHMSTHHPTIRTEGKSLGQLRSAHAASHKNGNHSHSHTPGHPFKVQ